MIPPPGIRKKNEENFSGKTSSKSANYDDNTNGFKETFNRKNQLEKQLELEGFSDLKLLPSRSRKVIYVIPPEHYMKPEDYKLAFQSSVDANEKEKQIEPQAVSEDPAEKEPGQVPTKKTKKKQEIPQPIEVECDCEKDGYTQICVSFFSKQKLN